jgi:starvation-inducible DNA-binding protein
MPTTVQNAVNIGIEDRSREDVANGLSTLLADTYALYLKTQNFHWNVTGPHFHSLHGMFEEQYTELAQAVDLVAERIRSLGSPTPASFLDFTERTSLEEARGQVRWQDMARILSEDHETVIRSIRPLVSQAEKAQDIATVDLLTQRLAAHEKTAWMLRSLLEEF